jgi:ankyrin repeat protein
MDINKRIFDLLKAHNWDAVNDILRAPSNKVDPNLRDEQHNYLVQYAILYNRPELVDALVNMGCKLDMLDHDGRTVAYLPIKYNYARILQSLMSYTPEQVGVHLVDYQDRHGNIPLHYAIQFNNIDAFKLLGPTSNPNIRDNEENNACHLAIQNPQMVEMLVDKGVDLSHPNNNQQTPLHLACFYNNNAVIKLFIKHHTHIDPHDSQHKTPLMYLVENGNIDMVRLMIDAKASVDVQDVFGNTPLHHSIVKQHPELVHVIVKHFNNFNNVNIDGETPLHTLLTHAKNIDSYPLETLLLRTNINIQDNYGDTALHHIVRSGLWQDHLNVLSTKKLNIFIRNKNDTRAIDLVKPEMKEAFTALVALSYYNLLQNKHNRWLEEWENQCNRLQAKNPKSKDECIDIIKRILPSRSLPTKESKYCVNIEQPDKIQTSTFTGSTLDIICGCLLLEQDKNIMTTLSDNFIDNKELMDTYNRMGYVKETRGEFFNFELMYVFDILVAPTTLSERIQRFNKSTRRFLALPLGIELAHGAHANMLVYDKKTNTMERFEPNGTDPPFQFLYNHAKLDTELQNMFTPFFRNLKYQKPKDFLPKIGFQSYEEIDVAARIGDPDGFCVVWSIWYAAQKAKHPDLPSDKLVKKLVRNIKMKNIYFRDYIRSFAKEITDKRASLLKDIDINDWINNTVTERQIKEVIARIASKMQNIM